MFFMSHLCQFWFTKLLIEWRLILGFPEILGFPFDRMTFEMEFSWIKVPRGETTAVYINTYSESFSLT